MSSVQEHYSTVADDNGEISGISIAEGSTQLRDLNDAIRQLMADVREESDELRARLSAIEASIDPQGEEEEGTAQQAAATAQEAATLAGGLQDQVTDAAAAAQTANEAATEASTASAAALTALADYEDRIVSMEDAVAQFDVGLVQTSTDQVIEGVKTFSEAIRADITGSANTAAMAEMDAEGNVITDTYATKELATTDAPGLMSPVDKNKLEVVSTLYDEIGGVSAMECIVDLSGEVQFGNVKLSPFPIAIGAADQNGRQLMFHILPHVVRNTPTPCGSFIFDAECEYVLFKAEMSALAGEMENVEDMEEASMNFPELPVNMPLPDEDAFETLVVPSEGTAEDESVVRLHFYFRETDETAGTTTYDVSAEWLPSDASTFLDGDETSEIVVAMGKVDATTKNVSIDIQPVVDLISDVADRASTLETSDELIEGRLNALETPLTNEEIDGIVFVEETPAATAQTEMAALIEEARSALAEIRTVASSTNSLVSRVVNLEATVPTALTNAELDGIFE